MKMLKKFSIFTIVTLLLCSFLCVSVFAETDGESTETIINQDGYELGVHCHECDTIGLKFDGVYFACQNKDCGYMYVIVCPFCGGKEYKQNDQGLFICQGTKDSDCGKVLTLIEMEQNLKLSKKPAGGKNDMNLKPESFSERLGYAVQGTVTGIVMVFAVLTLLCLILYASKLVFYDIPNKKRESEIAKKNAKVEASIAAEKEKEDQIDEVSAPVAVQDDGEIVAVITAAVAAMIESSEYKNEFVGGFRVVSFKRSDKTAWNRK